MLESSAPRRLPPSIGPYAIRRELGRGGMGVVLEATAPDGRSVAVKLLLKPGAQSALGRFDRERRLLAQLGEDRGFIPLLDAGTAPAGPYLVTPFLPGGTLRERLARKGSLQPEEVRDLGLAVARALGAAHELGIVHRDVKPENVIFDASGRPFLADLGLAKHFRDDAPGAAFSVSLTAHGDVAGTMGYVAPEQLDGSKGAGPPADVFALGAVLYECLAGVQPFQAKSTAAVIAKIATASFDSIEAVRKDCPPRLAAVITRALAREARNRYPDGNALRLALEDPALLAPARRGPPALAIGIAVVVAVGGAVALAAGRRSAGAPPKTPPPTPPPATAPVAKKDPAEEARKLVERGRTKLELGDLDAAIVLAEQALALDPRCARALVVRGRARGRKSDIANAAQDAQRAVELAPDLGEAYALRAATDKMLGKIEDALADFDRALAREPSEYVTYLNRSATYAELGRLDDAWRDIEKARELEPSAAEVWANRGTVRLLRGDPRGLEDLDRALELDPRKPENWVNRALARAQLEDRAGALADLDRAVELDPRKARSFQARAQVKNEVNDFAGALADADAALALDPDFAPSRFLRSDLRLRAGRTDDALADLNHLIERQPSATARCRRAAIRRKRHDVSGALADYAAALEADPKSKLAWLGRAELRLETGDRAGAIADLERALRLARDKEADAIAARIEELRGRR